MSSPLTLIPPHVPTADPLPTPTTVDLAHTLHAFEQWRINKTSPSEAIPDTLWHAIFALEKDFTPARLCALFGLSQRQYQKKLQALYPDKVAVHAADTVMPTTAPHGPSTAAPVSAFCEVKSAKSFYQPQPLPTPTPPFIIEFCRADGCIMKIYTSADRFSTLLTTFFAGTEHVAPAR